MLYKLSWSLLPPLTLNTVTYSYDTSDVLPEPLFAKNKQKSRYWFQFSTNFFRYILCKMSCSNYWEDRIFQVSAQTLFHNSFRPNSFTFIISFFNKWKHQLDATILSVYFTSIVHSTCFGCHIHPSSGASNMYNQVWYNLITV